MKERVHTKKTSFIVIYMRATRVLSLSPYNQNSISIYPKLQQSLVFKLYLIWNLKISATDRTRPLWCATSSIAYSIIHHYTFNLKKTKNWGDSLKEDHTVWTYTIQKVFTTSGVGCRSLPPFWLLCNICTQRSEYFINVLYCCVCCMVLMLSVRLDYDWFRLIALVLLLKI